MFYNNLTQTSTLYMLVALLEFQNNKNNSLATINHTRTIHTFDVAASGRIWHYFGDLNSKFVLISLAAQVQSNTLA